MPGLASMHTLWLREHNRLAREIKSVRPHLGDEEIFQTARRILIAEMQNIVYEEFLPLVLGHQAMSDYGVKLPSNTRCESEVVTTLHCTLFCQLFFI